MFDERGISDAQKEKLWKYYFNKFIKGVDVGYEPQLENYDPALAHRLKYNVAEFSAFKETSFRKELEGMLTKNGKILPWSKFKEKAFAVSEDYNKRWLKTEYHQTVATANMAGKWKDFEANQDLYPNLEYVDAGDSRVREKHHEWDGTILPINHPWWQTHYPPNDWGCRCNAVQTDAEPIVKIPAGDAKKGFNNNAGTTGQIFKDPAYKEGLTVKEIDEATAMANKLFKDQASTKSFITRQRKLVKDWAKKNLLGKEINHSDLLHPVEFNITGFKEFADQPFKFEAHKLEIIKDLESKIKEAKYVGSRNMDNPMIIKSHILESEFQNEKFWFVIRENKEGRNLFYSVSDRETITKGLKRENR